MPQFIMVRGNPVDGFSFVGPFPTRSSVVDDYGDTVDTEWWVAELEPPLSDEEPSHG